MTDTALGSEETSLKEIAFKVKEIFIYLRPKWGIVFLIGLLVGTIAFLNAYKQKTIYTADLTFALEEEKSGSGLSSALGLASSLGIDLGNSAGGAFNGPNLFELMKSRTLIRRSLLNSITVGNKSISLADYFMEFTGMKKSWTKNNGLEKISFNDFDDSKNNSFLKDSVFGIIYDKIIGENGVLSISQKDKKVSIITIEVKSEDEYFSKFYAESVAKEISDFYIETKSKKAKINVAILQKQTDSIRNELNSAITGVAVASDNVYNLNPALNIKRTPSSRKQIDVQSNTAILTQLVTNLEMAKVALLKETPLIQIIDRPVFPLIKHDVSKLRAFLNGFFLGVFLIIMVLVSIRFLKGLNA